ncbi:aminotransferase class V-fold PLP-dependent enzyme [Virgibacillus sp. LDC-1]|uniref:aminotransferase class V-fold PLP-dependent enzyme n=1 Tax=Virgibacillus sp. LDC-1 TaxID=3039856 RepID=UPI0024DE8572|nr:aminotransferase class V-fold PLP-dependent enzyme [Virgibacillus sp. LDC-1]
MIYLDQAASSFPKPPEVGEAMLHALNEIGANPGRGGHVHAREASKIIQEAREKAAQLFGCEDPKRVVFFQNATIALNQAIKGLEWRKGDHIIATYMEHNAVRRPLEHLKKKYGVTVSYVRFDGDDDAFIHAMKATICSQTKLIAVTHASNVTGAIIPLNEVIKVAKKHRIITLVDASQTAGHIPISMKAQGVDMLAFPGHKGILGPQGTGVLLVAQHLDLHPIHHGGTGSYSESPDQPEVWPEKLESGTLNTPGIAGLLAALQVYERKIHDNVSRETLLANKLLDGLNSIEGITCYGPLIEDVRLPIIAFNVNGIDAQEIAIVLDTHYQIAVRAGLHCNPLAHETLGTTEQGVVRVSFNATNTEEEIEAFLTAIEEITMAYEGM